MCLLLLAEASEISLRSLGSSLSASAFIAVVEGFLEVNSHSLCEAQFIEFIEMASELIAADKVRKAKARKAKARKAKAKGGSNA